MSFATTISALSSKVDGLIANRVAKFAYTQQAYNSDDVNGVENYDYAEEQNIPLGTTSVLKVNETILTKGWRTQASAITRMLMNHFLGRTSYNLNKTVDFLKSLMTAITDNMGVAEGFATLDANGRIPSSQLTEEVMEYKGEWNADTNTPELDEETGKKGDVYKVSVSGTQDLGEGEKYFRVDTYIIFNGIAYTVLSGEDVAKVNNIAPDSVGNVTLTGEDIATSSVDNMSLADKIKECLKLSFAPMLGRYWLENTTSSYEHVIHLNNLWLSYSEAGGIKYSEDGKAWVTSNITSATGSLVGWAYSNGVWFVAHGTGGLHYSKDGKTWELSLSACYRVPVYGNGVWVLSQANGVNLQYSLDGITWVTVNNTPTVIANVKYVNNIWLASFSTQNKIMYSSNGVEWFDSNLTSNAGFNDFMYAKGVYVAYDTSSSKGIKYSLDGITWVNTNITSDNFTSVVYANGVFICVNNDSSSSGIKYSLDGITWVNTNITSGAYHSPVYANGVWVVLGYSNNLGVKYSVDGITWTSTNITTGNYNLLKYRNGVWLISPRVSTSGKVQYSTDGINWFNTSIQSAYVSSIDYNKFTWVASKVGADINSSGIVYSDIDTLIENGWLQLD